MASRSVVVDGTVFFLIVVILISLFQVLSGTHYYLAQQPLIGIGLIGVAVVNAIAAYASRNLKRWGFMLAFIANLVYMVGLYASTVIPPFGYGPLEAFYGAVDISVRLIIMFFALESYREASTANPM